MKIVVATRNAHKLSEIRDILGPRFTYASLIDYPEVPTPVEDAPTFAGNAELKARHLAKWLEGEKRESLAVLADDSGLEVDALNGAPGVFSARFAALESGAAGNSSDADNNRKLLHLLEGIPPGRRTARFRCAVAWLRVGEERAEIFEGTCEGVIAEVPAGRGGFGYDPLFYPQGESASFAELGEEVKNRISHRARALEKLKGYLSSRRDF